MLHRKNLRTLSLISSYLCLIAILCLKVFIPLFHTEEVHHNNSTETSISITEDCFSCKVEHAAYLFDFSPVSSFSFFVFFIGSLILAPVLIGTTATSLFSPLRGPPVAYSYIS